jgi:hypothetical protein
LLDKLTPQQFQDWLDFYSLEPWGDERADLRMARIVWATLQKGNPKKVNERDYLFRFDHVSTRAASPEEYKRRSMAAWTGAGGGLSAKTD